MKISEKTIKLLLFDLYWLRYEKEGQQWYELTDYLRDKLKEDGVEINYEKDGIRAYTSSYGYITFTRKELEKLMKKYG